MSNQLTDVTRVLLFWWLVWRPRKNAVNLALSESEIYPFFHFYFFRCLPIVILLVGVSPFGKETFYQSMWHFLPWIFDGSALIRKM